MHAKATKATDYSIGLMHELVIAASKVGMQPRHLAQLVEDEEKLREVFDVILGKRTAANSVVWKTVLLGRDTDTDFHVAALKKAGVRLGEGAECVLRGLTFLQEPKQFDLVTRTSKEFGLHGRPVSYDRFLARGLELGYAPCPMETAIALVQHIGDLRLNEMLVVASLPIPASATNRHPPHVFQVCRTPHGAELRLNRHVHEGIDYSDSRLVFVLPAAE